MKSDSPIVDEVRARRRALSERFGDDLQAYGRHLRQIEEKYRNRTVNQITVVASPGRRPATPPSRE